MTFLKDLDDLDDLADCADGTGLLLAVTQGCAGVVVDSEAAVEGQGPTGRGRWAVDDHVLLPVLRVGHDRHDETAQSGRDTQEREEEGEAEHGPEARAVQATGVCPFPCGRLRPRRRR